MFSIFGFVLLLSLPLSFPSVRGMGGKERKGKERKEYAKENTADAI